MLEISILVFQDNESCVFFRITTIQQIYRYVSL